MLDVHPPELAGLLSGGGAEEVDDPVRERLSWARLFLVLLLVATLGAGGWFGYQRLQQQGEPLAPARAVPYVDTTLTPLHQFQDPAANPSRTVALGFVVAAPDAPCTPSWGGYYTLDQAAQALELDRRIAQLRSAGGDLMVSLGGQAGTELAQGCTDDARLVAAYRAVVDRYQVGTVDLDIEGAALSDDAGLTRRATAVAALQAERAAAGTPLGVWLTLPVAPSGLTADGVDAVRTMLAEGVELAGVNVMTMDYGTSGPGADMLDLATSALRATSDQVRQAYRARGVELTDAQVWARIGATPMIGQNDVDGEVFTLDDARGLAAFAREHGLGRVSFWSVNRDAPCGATFSGVVVHSNTCSGVDQEPMEFSRLLSDLGDTTAPSAAATTNVVVPAQRTVDDDPASSPFPIWRPTAQYVQGYKVVWHGEVYQAKWYTQGSDPSAPAVAGTPAPWDHLGPVREDDAPMKPVPVVHDVTTPWTATRQYIQGDRVLFAGLPYEAKWSTKGEPPVTEFPLDPGTPWRPLFTIPGEP